MVLPLPLAARLLLRQPVGGLRRRAAAASGGGSFRAPARLRGGPAAGGGGLAILRSSATAAVPAPNAPALPRGSLIARIADFGSRLRGRLPWLQLSYLVHVGNACAVCAMFSEDMLHLRSFMVCASTCAIWYNLLQPMPLVAPAAWGSFFVCGHLVQIVRILRDRVEVDFTEETADLFEFAFNPHGFRPRHFVKLYGAGRVEWVAAGELIAAAGEEASEIILIWNGTADVLDPVSGKVKNKLRKNRFIGNMVSSHGAHDWHNDIRATTPCKIIRWKRSELQKMLNADKELIGCVARMVAHDLSRKLTTTDQGRSLAEYRSMLSMAVADGRLVPEEKKQLYEFRKQHAITMADHMEALDEAGWSIEEYDHGAKNENLWPQNLKRLSHFLDRGTECASVVAEDAEGADVAAAAKTAAKASHDVPTV